MTREEQINKEKIYNQLTELLGAIDKQPKSIEVVLDKRQLNIAEEAEKRYLGRPPYQYYSAEDLTMAFREGAEYADANPKSPWISVEDDLPCNHHSMICEVCKGVEYETNSVLVLLIDGTIEISYMYHRMPYTWSWNTYKVTHWMPIPNLQKE